MSATFETGITSDTALDDTVFRKVFRRLMWFLFILLVVSFMDRINIAFAALTMNKDLGLTAAAYGLSLTVFYAAYTVCEIPSNLALARFGARLWITRIMITWGIASAATVFAVGMWSLYGIRAVVGAAEAGFLPGILLYLTYWFPRSCRARANALFVMGIPATIAIASTLSGFILQMHGFLVWPVGAGYSCSRGYRRLFSASSAFSILMMARRWQAGSATMRSGKSRHGSSATARLSKTQQHSAGF